MHICFKRIRNRSLLAWASQLALLVQLHHCLECITIQTPLQTRKCLRVSQCVMGVWACSVMNVVCYVMR